MISVRPLLVLLALPLSIAELGAQGVNPQSPFLPATGGTAASAPPSTNYELVGIIASEKKTLVGITDKTTHRSFWIRVGQTSDGVEVVSCDPQKDRAVIKAGGQTQSLTMHATSPTAPAASAATGPMPPPSPGPGAGVSPNAPQAEQEREARMLVSDLLEISIQQRKAYEESQKKAAAAKAGQPQKPPAPNGAAAR